MFATHVASSAPVKSITRQLDMGMVSRDRISIDVYENDAVLRINGFPYFLEPEELPSMEALQTMLRHERVGVYMEVVAMLKELSCS